MPGVENKVASRDDFRAFLPVKTSVWSGVRDWDGLDKIECLKRRFCDFAFGWSCAACFCSLKEVAGTGRAAPQSHTNNRRSADGSAVE